MLSKRIASGLFIMFVLGLFLIACQPDELDTASARSIEWRHSDVTDIENRIFSAVNDAVTLEMRDNRIPGVALAIVKDGRTIYKKGYGLENVETGQIVDPDKTIFRIGSTSKALTLLTLARMIDDGRLNRTDSVVRLFSGIPNSQNFSAPITFDHLLTHTSGFDQPGYGRQIGGFELALAERQAARPSLSNFLTANPNLRRINLPGEYFRYDTYGPTLAGAIMEKVTDHSYADMMKQEMFDEIGMTRTAVEVRPENYPNLAKGHGYIDGEFITQPYEIYLTTPASSIDSTAADMGRLLEALTGGGRNEYGRLFSEETARAVLSPHYRPHPDFAGMTHGLWESLSVGRGSDAIPIRTIGHGGDMWGFNGSMEIIPEFNLGFYVVANRNGEGGGPRVSIGRTVMLAILSVLTPDRKAEPATVPAIDSSIDLSEYAGDYFWGVYCHTCSAVEFELGAWRKPRPISISSSDGTLRIEDKEYVWLSADMFISMDGFDQIFFKRGKDGQITSFSRREDPTVYERSG